jgi:hypothetical protein
MLVATSLITVLNIFGGVALLDPALSHPLTLLVIETVQGRLFIYAIQLVSLLRKRHLTLLNDVVRTIHSM